MFMSGLITVGISKTTCPLRSRPPNHTINGAVPIQQRRRTVPAVPAEPYQQRRCTEPTAAPNRTSSTSRISRTNNLKNPFENLEAQDIYDFIKDYLNYWFGWWFSSAPLLVRYGAVYDTVRRCCWYGSAGTAVKM
ncbi:hypothetical protein BpHYR1_054479 [Brachionus plicatilis]|uniref:Uncharacterized protein n=1 Tax=Brachionus plicatilis TaxID=10195 RepID=A0A3M7RQC2_BRAPC|nr:hypothetical protein BpHYR1_054479 [Brachionus plicatilis]